MASCGNVTLDEGSIARYDPIKKDRQHILDHQTIRRRQAIHHHLVIIIGVRSDVASLGDETTPDDDRSSGNSNYNRFIRLDASVACLSMDHRLIHDHLEIQQRLEIIRHQVM
jgi:hypothetical protein